MVRVRVTPRIGGLPELSTFQCGNCGEVETVAADDPNLPDPRDD
jgi:hypothetical protein